RLLKFKLKRIDTLIVSDCIGIFITARRRKLRIGSLISFAFASIKPRLHAQRLSTSMLYKRITRLHGETQALKWQAYYFFSNHVIFLMILIQSPYYPKRLIKRTIIH